MLELVMLLSPLNRIPVPVLLTAGTPATVMLLLYCSWCQLPVRCLIASATALQVQANLPPSPFMAEGVGPAADHSAGDTTGRLRERRLSSEQLPMHCCPVTRAALAALLPCAVSSLPRTSAQSSVSCALSSKQLPLNCQFGSMHGSPVGCCHPSVPAGYHFSIALLRQTGCSTS